VKDAQPGVSWSGNGKHQGDMEPGTLKIGNPDAVLSGPEVYMTLLFDHRVLSVVLNDLSVVDVQNGAIVGS